jgi:hypothetical protein
MVGNEIREAQHVQPLPLLDAEKRKRLLSQAQDLFHQDGKDQAEQYLLKKFHRFNLGNESSYDLLIEFYYDRGSGLAKITG